MNVVVLRGTLSRDADRRELASGSVLLQLDVATPTEAGVATVPVSWSEPPAEAVFAAGDEVVVVGAVRRRFFRAGGATQSRTEVAARCVLKPTQRKAVTKALAEAVAAIGGG